MSITVGVDLARTDCCVCGVTFAIPHWMLEKRRNDGGQYFCPNGHSLVFREPRVIRLQLELDDTNRRLAESSAAILRERAVNDELRKKADRARRRINAGVCLHCHRSFTNLRRHIETVHADQIPEGRIPKSRRKIP